MAEGPEGKVLRLDIRKPSCVLRSSLGLCDWQRSDENNQQEIERTTLSPSLTSTVNASVRLPMTRSVFLALAIPDRDLARPNLVECSAVQCSAVEQEESSPSAL
ncbi:hypothetical protein Mapa_006803 [Marchantia paleacea]|nr:hypothetical protein Mapa_006803 [Marchantia paleacea]